LTIRKRGGKKEKRKKESSRKSVMKRLLDIVNRLFRRKPTKPSDGASEEVQETVLETKYFMSIHNVYRVTMTDRGRVDLRTMLATAIEVLECATEYCYKMEVGCTVDPFPISPKLCTKLDRTEFGMLSKLMNNLCRQIYM